MTVLKQLVPFAVALILITIVAVFVSFQPDPAYGSAITGLPADTTSATSSAIAVTNTASTVFATSSMCSARIITSYASPLMLTFSDNQGKTPTGVYGHLQPASTTVAYDSGLYGCGAVKIYSFVSQTISVTETK